MTEHPVVPDRYSQTRDQRPHHEGSPQVRRGDHANHEERYRYQPNEREGYEAEP